MDFLVVVLRCKTTKLWAQKGKLKAEDNAKKCWTTAVIKAKMREDLRGILLFVALFFKHILVFSFNCFLY